MGARVFFLSLIILAVAMGVHYQRYGPKKEIKPRKPVTIPTDSRRIPVPDDVTSGSDDGNFASAPMSAASGTPSMDDFQLTASSTGMGSEGGSHGDGSENAAGSHETADVKGGADPILLAWSNLNRNPFEGSPYEKVLSEKRQNQGNGSGSEEGSGSLAVTKKPTKALEAGYSGSIMLDSGVVAFIGRENYRVNDLYERKKITKIEPTLITLEDDEAVYLMPFRNYKVAIASDGSYSMIDENPKQLLR